MAVVWTVDGALTGWTTYGLAHDLPGTDFAYWFVARFGAVLLSGLVALLLLYPTGRLLSGRWRPLAAATLCASFALPVMLVLAPDSVVFTDPVLGVNTELVTLPFSDDTATTLLYGAQALTFASIVLAVAMLWVRHRRADAHERTQLRWLLWAGIMCVLLVVAGATLSVSGAVTTVVLDLAVTALAVSLAIGLVRPDLGDVDALVAWTLTSAAVAAVVVAIDLAVIASANALLGDRLDEREVTLVVLVLAVVVYGPLRSWLGGGVRRLLLGRRSDRYGAVSSLAARLETTGSVEEQLPALAGAVAATFKVQHVRVEVVDTERGRCWPRPTERPPARFRRSTSPTTASGSGGSCCRCWGSARCSRAATRACWSTWSARRRSRSAPVCSPPSCRRAASGWCSGVRRTGVASGATCTTDSGPALGGVALRLEAAGNAVGPDPDRARELVRLARTRGPRGAR